VREGVPETFLLYEVVLLIHTQQEHHDTIALRSQDIVVLRANRSLIGTVSQTYLDSEHDSLDDPLIIAHSPIPSSAIHDFVTHGVPPKGFIFIEWARAEYGHSLVAQQDVILVDRPFNIGDTVKNATDSMVGTVINVFESYTLEPIARITDGAIDFVRSSFRANDGLASSSPGEVPLGEENSGLAEISNWHYPKALSNAENQSDGLLLDIPGEELKRAANFREGDYVIRKDWVGIVEDSDPEVVLLLENNTLVVVKDPEELELVIPDFGKPLITLPDLDGIRQPDVITAHAGGMMSTPYHHLQRGQFVITNPKNIREGRWLVGSYHENCKPQGFIVDIRALRLEVQWLCPNPFALESPSMLHGPSSNVRPYENLSTFNIPSELRRNKSLALYDRLRQPVSSNGDSLIFPGHGTMRANRVMFKDLAGAALKYEAGGRHGRFERIPKDYAFGFDLNEFAIVSCRQEAQIQWQDERITRERSTTLTPYTLPEAELCPGDIVTLKQGTKQAAIGSPDNTAVEFNEMLYFQGNFRLWPEKIGVIQSVDSNERLARLRLFASPKVELLEQGHVLRAGSRLGKISDVVEEVSLYEVMSHPALLRRRGDLVILPPERPSQDVILQLQSNTGSSPLGPSTLSYLRSVHPASKFEHLRNIAKHYVESYGSSEHGILPGIACQSSYDANRPLDWIGEIMDLRTDGLATVRLGALGSDCRDINVPFERVLMVVDDDAELDEGSSQMSDVDPWSEYRSDSDEDDDDSAFLEEVEYEGGKRLDDDSDSVWMTDDEEAEQKDVVMEDPPAVDPLDVAQDRNTKNLPHEVEVTGPSSTPSGHEGQRLRPSIRDLVALRAESGSDRPSAFHILDSEPPSDQFSLSQTPSALSAAFLRRVNREHRVLSTSLPADEIYVRTYESRLDLLRCLIIGPKDTPYEHAPFVIDLQLGPEFPKVPPVAHFHSWTGGLGRINPNLYEEGKICLSLLNTWPGQSEGESWSEKASILQVLISLMGLVLVKQPFYNEAGFESYGEEKLYIRESQQYSEKAYVMARGFVKHAVSNPVEGLEDVLAYLYLSPRRLDATEPSNSTSSAHGGLLRVVIDRSIALIEGSTALRGSDDVLVDGAGRPGDSTKTFLRPLSQGAVVMLKKTVKSLRELLEMVENPDSGS
jgi:ubiquitin-conjugating enzyme E2 O